jgi:hypothetical protein
MQQFMAAISAVLLFAVTLPTLHAQATSTDKKAYLSSDYQKYNLQAGSVPEKWEDGLRTTGGKGSYEWWYFDTHLEDGSSAVIVFFTKDFVQANRKITPTISLNIDRPDGSKIVRRIEYKESQATFLKDSCHVQIGKSYFKGNLKEYEIHFEDEGLIIDARLTRQTNSWRPKTGHIELKGKKDHYFAWLVPVPYGTVNFSYSLGEEQKTLQGEGYHDHNWGDVSLMDLFNHWYWSRAKVGPYNVIAFDMITEKEYGKEPIVMFNISKDGETVADDEQLVKTYRSYGQVHPKLKKDISDDLLWVYDNPKDSSRYEYSLFREKSMLEVDMLAVVVPSGFLRFFVRMLTGFDGSYYRFTGPTQLRVFRDGELKEEQVTEASIWELMYFGKVQR